MIVALVASLLLAQNASPSPLPSASPSPLVSPAPVATTTPKPQPIVRVPPGWTKLANKGDTGSSQLKSMGQWLHIGDASIESMNVITGPNSGMSVEQVAELNKNELQKSMTKGKILSSHAIPLCNGTQGWQLRYVNQLGDTKMAITAVIAVTTSHIYVATYGHSADAKDSVAGVRAVSSLCPPPEAAVADSGPAPLQPPAGWTRGSMTASSDPAADVPRWLWYGPVTGTSAPVIIVTSFPSPTAAAGDDDLLKLVTGYFEKNFGPVQIVDKQTVTLCNVTQGLLVHLNSTVKGKALSMVAVLSGGVPTSYMAFYMHLTSLPELPEAVTSVQTLCPADRQSSG